MAAACMISPVAERMKRQFPKLIYESSNLSRASIFILIEGSFNGRTADFESANLGSNPSPSANFEESSNW